MWAVAAAAVDVAAVKTIAAEQMHSDGENPGSDTTACVAAAVAAVVVVVAAGVSSGWEVVEEVSRGCVVQL